MAKSHMTNQFAVLIVTGLRSVQYVHLLEPLHQLPEYSYSMNMTFHNLIPMKEIYPRTHLHMQVLNVPNFHLEF